MKTKSPNTWGIAAEHFYMSNTQMRLSVQDRVVLFEPYFPYIQIPLKDFDVVK